MKKIRALVQRAEPYARAVVAFFAPLLADLGVQLEAGRVDWQALMRRAYVYVIGAVIAWAVPHTHAQHDPPRLPIPAPIPPGGPQ